MPEVMAGQLADNDKIGLINKKRLFIILMYIKGLFFLFRGHMKKDKDKALNNIRKAALLYNKNFLGKDILYVHGSVDEPEFLEATFYKKHFFHLTGVVLGEKSEISSAKDFFDSSISKTLSVNDFMLKDNGTTDLKLEILPKFLESTASSRMVGYFNKSGVKLETKILAGRDFVAMGFNKYKGDNPKFYVPNTILNNDIRKLIDKHK